MRKTTLSKKQLAIVHNVTDRWAQTIFEGKPDFAAATKLIEAGYSSGIGSHRSTNRMLRMGLKHRPRFGKPTFYAVLSPVAFMIAVSVIRGRMTKRDAKTLCDEMNIDASFLRPLRRDKLVAWNVHRHTAMNGWWSRERTLNEFTRTWRRIADEKYLAAEKSIASSQNLYRASGSRPPESAAIDVVKYSTNSFDHCFPAIRSMLNDSAGLQAPKDLTNARFGLDTHSAVSADAFRAQAVWDGRSTNDLIGDINTAVNVTHFVPTANEINPPNILTRRRPNSVTVDDMTSSAVDAEILCRLLGVTDPEIIWEHEVFHHCTAFATFENSCVVLAERPKIVLNADKNLHNDTGPAVTWSDGSRLWFNDGHFLAEGGKYIIEEPHKLSTDLIMRMTNEETRRAAIDRYGWDKFIVETGCPVIDKETNDIDNTREILFGAIDRDQARVRSARRHIMLFCRSTGRRYFNAVPATVKNCGEAQEWLSGGAFNPCLDYAKHPIRVIGAS